MGLFSILFTVGADTQPMRNALEKARGQVKSFGGDIKSYLAGAVGVGAFGALIASTVNYGDKIQDLSDRFNVSTTALQKFGNVAEQNGSSLESFAMGFNRLGIASSKALGGDSAALRAFESLGISIDDLRSKSPEQIMELIARSSMNAADMVAILGRNAMELIPTLEAIRDGATSPIISPEDIKSLAALSDTLKGLQASLRLVAANGLGPLAEGLRIVIDYATAGSRAIGTLAGALGAAAFTKGVSFKDAIRSARETIDQDLSKLRDPESKGDPEAAKRYKEMQSQKRERDAQYEDAVKRKLEGAAVDQRIEEAFNKLSEKVAQTDIGGYQPRDRTQQSASTNTVQADELRRVGGGATASLAGVGTFTEMQKQTNALQSIDTGISELRKAVEDNTFDPAEFAGGV
jgi:hypothetical protein